jgi:hypothetical protein
MSVTHNIRRITVMSKKLLSEAQIRRFQSLANMPVVNEMYRAKKDEDLEEGQYGMEEMAHKDKMEEDGHMEEDKHGMKEDMHDEEKEEMDMEPEMEPEAMPEGGDLDLTEEEARVLIELGKKLEGIMGDGAEMDDMEAGADLEAAAELDGAETELDDPEDMLEGISVEPSRKEVVEEVARRVARRLNEAKRAQRRLNRALGNK